MLRITVSNDYARRIGDTFSVFTSGGDRLLDEGEVLALVELGKSKGTAALDPNAAVLLSAYFRDSAFSSDEARQALFEQLLASGLTEETIRSPSEALGRFMTLPPQQQFKRIYPNAYQGEFNSGTPPYYLTDVTITAMDLSEVPEELAQAAEMAAQKVQEDIEQGGAVPPGSVIMEPPMYGEVEMNRLSVGGETYGYQFDVEGYVNQTGHWAYRKRMLFDSDFKFIGWLGEM
jgi:hypothetical protein